MRNLEFPPPLLIAPMPSNTAPRCVPFSVITVAEGDASRALAGAGASIAAANRAAEEIDTTRLARFVISGTLPAAPAQRGRAIGPGRGDWGRGGGGQARGAGPVRAGALPHRCPIVVVGRPASTASV